MKKLSFILLFVFSFYFCANAQSLLVENFDYPAGDTIGAHGWVVFSGTTNILSVVSPGLTFTGYSQSGIGNCTRIHNNGQDDYKQFTADSIGTMYVAFMVKVDSALTGDYFFALLPNNSTSNYTARVWAKDSLGTIQFGISKSSSTGGPIVYGTNGYAYGTTYLLIVKYKFNTGSTTDDEMSLFAFSTAPPTTEPATPYVGPVTGTIADAPNIARIAVRQGTATSSPTLNIDGFMVTTAWPITPTAAWSEQTSGVTTALYSVSAVDDNVAWACGAAGKVLKTTNSGLNWVNVSGNITPSMELYNIFAFNSSIALVTTSPSTGGSVTIWKTSNGGTNWTTVYTRTSAAAFGDALWMTDINTAYYYGDPQSSNWDLLKSTNGGDNWVTWATVPAGTAGGGWNNGMFIQGTNVWLGTNVNSLVYSSNMGVNWTTQTTPAINQYSIFFTNGTNGLAGGAAMYQTSNTGTNWTSLTSPATSNISGIAGNGSEWWFCDQAAAPKIYYSANNGTNWAAQYQPTTNGGVWYHMTKARTGTTLWAVRSLGGISRYGQPIVVPPPVWSEQPSGVTTALYSVSAVDDNVAWACGAAGKVLKTTNSGVNWINVSGNITPSMELYNIFAFSSTLALVTTSPSTGGSVTIWKTSNGGTNWTTVYTRTSAAAFGDALWMTDANTAYYYGDPQSSNWDLLKSTNGGDNWVTWATVPAGTAGGGWNNGMFIQGTNVWLGTNVNSLVYSSNMGVNWTTQTTPAINQYSIYFTNGTNGLSGGAAMYQTTNTGTNWTSLTSPATSNISGIAGNGSEWWFCDQAATPKIYYSSNNGVNWATQYQPTTNGGVWYHMTKARTGTTLWAVRSLGGISRYGTPLTGIIGISSNIPENYSLSQNYPNPFNPVTKIKFAIPKTGMVTIKVYNILGKEVTKLVNEIKSPGTYLVDFDGSSLSSGVYFYKLESNGYSVSKKMMLIK